MDFGFAWTDIAALLIVTVGVVTIVSMAVIVGFAIWAAKHPGL